MSCVADQVALMELSSASTLVTFLLRLYKIRPNSFVISNVSFISSVLLKYSAFQAMSWGRPEPVGGSAPEECSPNPLPSSPPPPHILESPGKGRAHTNNLCFSVKQHAFPVFPSVFTAVQPMQAEDNSADRDSITRQPLPSVKYMPLSSLSFLLPSAGRRSKVVLC